MINKITPHPTGEHITRITKNAKTLRRLLDSRFTPGYAANELYKTHLENSLVCPTLGQIAHYQLIKKPHKILPGCFEKNMKTLEHDPEIKYLKDILAARMKKLYPTTQKVRKYIIESGRLTLDKTEGRRKYNFIDRLKILFK